MVLEKHGSINYLIQLLFVKNELFVLHKIYSELFLFDVITLLIDIKPISVFLLTTICRNRMYLYSPKIMIMKTYISKNLFMLFILISIQISCMAQSGYIAINEKYVIHEEFITTEPHMNKPVKLIKYCIDDTNVFGSQLFELGFETSKYVVGIVKLEMDCNTSNLKNENIIARTFKGNKKWFLEVEDLDGTSALSSNMHCIKLMVHKKQNN